MKQKQAKAFIVREQNFGVVILKNQLEKFNLEVDILNEDINKTSLLNKVQSNMPDFLFIDYKWMDVAKETMSQFPHIIVISLVHAIEPFSVVPCIKMGAKNVISSPFSERDVYRVLSMSGIKEKVFVSALPDFTESLFNEPSYDYEKEKTAKMHHFLKNHSSYYPKTTVDFLKTCVITKAKPKDEVSIEIGNSLCSVMFRFYLTDEHTPHFHSSQNITFLKEELEDIEDILVESEVFFTF